jgi:serine/threonine-protein kinase
MQDNNTQGFKELQPGTMLNNGKYTIEKKIGAGGFGITYKAVQNGLSRTVCIKEYFPAGKCVRNTQAKTVHLQGISESMFEKYRQAFVKEARTLASLKHPNIVEVIDVFDENNTSYMVMPFIEGKSLQSIVENQGKLSYPNAVNYIAQVTNAVGYIHERHILHRDIKPDNVMITADYKAILIDFGSAREFEHDKTQAHTSMLTHGYAPTEQYTTNSRKGAYTDIYAIGATFYFALTGKMPLEAAARMTEKMPDPKELNPEIPDEANRTILKAMQIKAENRHQNVQEFMDDLRNIKPSTLVDETIGRTVIVKKTHKWLWWALGVIVLLLSGGVVWYFENETKHRENLLRIEDERLRLAINEMLNGQVFDLKVVLFGEHWAYLQPAKGVHDQPIWYMVGEHNSPGTVETSASAPSISPDCSFRYTGQMKDGFPHGEGSAYYDNGDQYTGNFRRGLRHGNGRRIFANGMTYEGNYENGKAHGHGKLTYYDGGYYDGLWKNDKQNGFGRFFDSNQNETKGIFEDGKLKEIK